MLRNALAQTNLSCLILLSLAAFLSSIADRLLQLKLGSISVFLAPSGDNLGAGVTYMLLPLTLLLVPISLFFNNPHRRLKYLQITMLIKALMALLLSLDLSREFLSQGSPRVGYSLSLIFLAGEWTVICMVVYLSQKAPRPLIYLSVLAAAYFSGQALALVLAPYVVSQPFTNNFAAFCAALYVVAAYATKHCKNLQLTHVLSASFPGATTPLPGGVGPANSTLKGIPSSNGVSARHCPSSTYGPASTYSPSSNEACTQSFSSTLSPFSTYRLLAATVLLYTPLYVCLLLSLFYALQGYQAGTLTFAELAAKAAVAFALGACASTFLHHIASRRRVLQTVAAATTLLAALGGLSYSYDTSLFTLMAITGLAGFITPDWENHLLSVLPPGVLAPFFAARNTIVMVLIALLSPTVERSLAAVSALYVLKELNILILASALLASLTAPLLLARRQQKVHFRFLDKALHQGRHEALEEAHLLTMSEPV